MQNPKEMNFRHVGNTQDSKPPVPSGRIYLPVFLRLTTILSVIFPSGVLVSRRVRRDVALRDHLTFELLAEVFSSKCICLTFFSEFI